MRADGLPVPRRYWAIAAIVLAITMSVLDSTIVNVALPHIQSDLKFGANDLQWVISAYTLIFGGFLLLGGRMADLIGRRLVFVIVHHVVSDGHGPCLEETHDIVYRDLPRAGAPAPPRRPAAPEASVLRTIPKRTSAK